MASRHEVTGVVDAWAVLALLLGEPIVTAARDLLGPGIVMSSINLGEVYYAIMRSHGLRVADERTAAIRRAITVEDPGWPLVTAAARIKAAGGLSFADAFCVATAERHGVPVYTGDPEILALSVAVPLRDIRGG
jgi:PIN domain nuclease of toxin-antitoxin system